MFFLACFLLISIVKREKVQITMGFILIDQPAEWQRLRCLHRCRVFGNLIKGRNNAALATHHYQQGIDPKNHA
ncbi:MAG: hypothetical protein C4527_12430 [Candidatus Omnitrophota bacterium]|nr:MAG: hypothetical protein C4527_12430 [Candidatus Omnitrophota bacterium]